MFLETAVQILHHKYTYHGHVRGLPHRLVLALSEKLQPSARGVNCTLEIMTVPVSESVMRTE